MSRSKPKPLEKQVADFVIFHLADRGAFAPFTGTDFDAWRAFLPLVVLYGRMRGGSHEADIIAAMRAVVGSAQARHADVMAVFKKSIPCILDWNDEIHLWREVAPGSAADPMHPCGDGPRICSHIHSKPSKKRSGWFICKDSTCREEWHPDDGGSVVRPVIEGEEHVS